MTKRTAFPTAIAAIALLTTSACGVECPPPRLKIDGRCQVPMDGGMDGGIGGEADAAALDGGDTGPDECGGSCGSSEFCFEAACVEADFCSGALGVPCDAFGPQTLTADTPKSLELYGTSIAVSGNGEWLAVGAPEAFEQGHSTDPEDAGHVYMYRNQGGSWTFVQRLAAENGMPYDHFGYSLSIDASGETLAVGAPSRDHVHVFTRSGTFWQEDAELETPSGPGSFDGFGGSVGLSDSGSVLIVGSGSSRRVFIYELRQSWTEVEELSKPSGTLFFGRSVALAQNGALAVVGAHNAAFVYTSSSSSWGNPQEVRSPVTASQSQFGSAVDLSEDGTQLAVSAPELTSGSGGRVYMFTSNGAGWAHTDTLEGSNTETGDLFGSHLQFSGDGSALAVGALEEDSSGIGLQTLTVNNSAENSGASYLFRLTGARWEQTAFVKGNDTRAGRRFGHRVSLDHTGQWLASSTKSGFGTAFVFRMAP